MTLHSMQPEMNDSDSQHGTERHIPTDVLDAAQFAAEFQECYSQLWLLAAAVLGDRHHAEDVVQDAAIVALRRLEQYEPGTNFAAWMSRIVRLQALNRSRKRQRRRTYPVDPNTLDLQAEGIETTDGAIDPRKSLPPEQTFFDDVVMQALNSLGEVARACLLLRTLHHLSYAELAEMLDIPEGTAMSHVHRSKSLLRQRLSQQATASNKTAER